MVFVRKTCRSVIADFDYQKISKYHEWIKWSDSNKRVID